MRKIKLLIRNLFNIPKRLFSRISLFVVLDKSKIDPTAAILAGTRIYWSSIQKYTYISDHCWIIKCEIGSFCSIASNVMIGGGKHPVNFVSTSPAFYSKRNILKASFAEFQFEEYHKTIIGSDVWIGSNAFIKGGITIGHGAVIGACSVVTKDVEPYSIVAGNPARLIRKRFDDTVIQKLIKSEWWNLSDEVLKKRGAYFNNVDEFLKIEGQIIKNSV